MSDLKSLNNYIANNNPTNPKITTNFPAFYFYKPSVVFAFNRVNLGLIYSFYSTGSRVSIKDYSGEYRFDTKLKSSAYGFLTEINLHTQKHFKIDLYNELGLIKTSLNLVEFFKVYDQTLADNNYNFDSKNYYCEPGLKASYTLSSFEFAFNLGYFQQFGDEVFNGKNNTWISVDGEKAGPDWSGLRVGMSVYLVIPFKGKVKSEI
jgi:hypothetical protein